LGTHFQTRSLSAEQIGDEVQKIATQDRLGSDQPHVTLYNDLGNVSFQCFESIPQNLNDLVNLIAKAKRENLKIKAIGAFYAFS
jgi:hypothetical protein